MALESFCLSLMKYLGSGGSGIQKMVEAMSDWASHDLLPDYLDLKQSTLTACSGVERNLQNSNSVRTHLLVARQIKTKTAN